MNGSYNGFLSNLTVFGALYSANKVIDALYHVQDLCFSCYYGALESYYLVVKYGQFTKNPSFILINLVYNFGLMYDDLKSSLAFFSGHPIVGTTDTFSVGFDLG